MTTITDTGWIQTSTRRALFPLAPDPASITLVDIAAGCARECRYAGQIERLEFYSVAEHCVLLSYAVPDHLKRWALMHDSSEGLGLRDIPAPIKASIPGYKALEAVLMAAVAERFGLVWPMPRELKAYDLRIRANERDALWAGPPPLPWGDDPGEPLPDVRIKGWLPREARRAFLSRACDLGIS